MIELVSTVQHDFLSRMKTISAALLVLFAVYTGPRQATAQDSPPQLMNPSNTWVSPALGQSDSTIFTYAEITGVRLGFVSLRLSVRIDSGQIVEVDPGRGRPLAGGDFYPYSSMTGALNALTRRGYQLVSMQTIVTAESFHGMVWVVRRPMRREELME